MQKHVAIIGAGPAGLMAAEILSNAGVLVSVFEAKASAGRKFLMAGKGGLNITHNEPFDSFVKRYDKPDWLTPMLATFTSDDIRLWMQQLGVSSFVGSSGRVFPLEMKAAPLLRSWLTRLKAQHVQFYYRHYWQGLCSQKGAHSFTTPIGEKTVHADAVVLALGGGSWPALGSDGQWVTSFIQQNIAVAPLLPSNHGFNIAWSSYMQAFAGQPLKRVVGWIEDKNGSKIAQHHAEAVFTDYGIEGGLVYALSRYLREQCLCDGKTVLYLDLLPNVAEQVLCERLCTQKKQTLNNIWRKAGLDASKTALIREYVPKSQWHDAAFIAAYCKRMPLPIIGMQPLEKAISSAGGVMRTALTESLMLQQIPHVFCCGEMLDWDAPTGGYLLSACLASGKFAGQAVLEYLERS